MKTVAIWSSLKFTNYGDDLQALAYAKLIKSMGYNVKLFQLHPSFAKMYDVETVDTIDELCKDVNLCIIAGGGLLSPFNWFRRTFNGPYAEWELMFKDLYEATVKYGTKFCAISMGGDGKLYDPKKYYGEWRNKFFSHPNFLNGAVRLEGDVKVMKQCFHKDFKWFPDMLLKATDFFEPVMLPPTEKFRVGLNLKKNRTTKYKGGWNPLKDWTYLDKKFVADLLEYAETHDDIEFHFTTTHLEEVGLNYQYFPEHESKNVFIDKYTSPQQLFGVLSSVDVFVTSMLHLGLTGLCNGTPFLSYRGPGKAQSFLRSIDGGWAIVDDNISFKDMRDKFFTQSKAQLVSQYNMAKLEEMKVGSAQNYEFCRQIVEKYA